MHAEDKHTQGWWDKWDSDKPLAQMFNFNQHKFSETLHLCILLLACLFVSVWVCMCMRSKVWLCLLQSQRKPQSRRKMLNFFEVSTDRLCRDIDINDISLSDCLTKSSSSEHHLKLHSGSTVKWIYLGLQQRIDKINKIQQLKVLAVNFLSIRCVVWLLRYSLYLFTCRQSWTKRGGGVTVLTSLTKTDENISQWPCFHDEDKRTTR